MKRSKVVVLACSVGLHHVLGNCVCLAALFVIVSFRLH